MLCKGEVHEKLKRDFLIENNLEEIRNIKVERTNYNFDDIDLENEEIWMLQCPKGTSLSAMAGHKLKFPGRTNFPQLEVVTSEWKEKKQVAFGYCKQQEWSGVRLLPVKGNILVRKSLKSYDDIKSEQVEASCVHAGRPNMPEFVKIRHPLFGQSYKNELKLKQEIEERLEKADKTSLKITAHARNLTLYSKSKILPTQDKTADKELKKKKGVKRGNNVEGSFLNKRSKNDQIKDEIADDLQWLKNV